MTATSASSVNLRHYILVTLAYWGFTITDGALRMLVLLYFNNIGYTPLQIASLFLFYEIFGVVTNFLGGWIGSQFGLKVTLYAGIGLQVVALVMLSLLNPAWAQWVAVFLCHGGSGPFRDCQRSDQDEFQECDSPGGAATGPILAV